MIEEDLADIRRIVDQIADWSTRDKTESYEELFGYGAISLESIAVVVAQNAAALARIEALLAAAAVDAEAGQ